jgi:hypothetical protein
MCKHDKLFIDKKDAEINGPEHIKAAYDSLKLKRYSFDETPFLKA